MNPTESIVDLKYKLKKQNAFMNFNNNNYNLLEEILKNYQIKKEVQKRNQRT